MKNIALLVVLMISLSGCSVFMAATSHPEPDITILAQGQTRAVIEKELGKPIQNIREGTGDRATYQFITGDKPDYRRAAVYALLTGVTLGASELVTSPIEALQGQRHVVEVFYDTRGRVRSFRHTVNDAPLPRPQELVGLSKES